MNQSKDWSEKMYQFVDRHPEGVREKDAKEEFEAKGKLSHSTFVKHWKNLKESGRIERILGDDGSIRYRTHTNIGKRTSQIRSGKNKLPIIVSLLSEVIITFLAIEIYPYMLLLVALLPLVTLYKLRHSETFGKFSYVKTQFD